MKQPIHLKQEAESSAPLPPPGRIALLLSGMSAVLACACCLGPLILVMLGVSGAWISHLAALEPYRPVFVAVSLLALATAAYRLWNRPHCCGTDPICTMPPVRRGYRLLFIAVATLTLLMLALPLTAPWFY